MIKSGLGFVLFGLVLWALLMEAAPVGRLAILLTVVLLTGAGLVHNLIPNGRRRFH